MKRINNHSTSVKREIFEEISQEPRFIGILQKVADNFKKGQSPVVIESFNTYWQRVGAEDSVWDTILPDEARDDLRKACVRESSNVEMRASLNTQLEKPYLEANISVCISSRSCGRSTKKHTVTLPSEKMSQLVFFGYRDKNYLKLFFGSLGYSVSDGNMGNRYGLLITLGNDNENK